MGNEAWKLHNMRSRLLLYSERFTGGKGRATKVGKCGLGKQRPIQAPATPVTCCKHFEETPLMYDVGNTQTIQTTSVTTYRLVTFGFFT